MAEQLFIDDIQGICESVVSQAKSGNMQAAKIILDRLFPASKDRPISIELPIITTPHDILKAVGTIAQAVARGEMSPLEGEALAKINHTNSIKDFLDWSKRPFHEKFSSKKAEAIGKQIQN